MKRTDQRQQMSCWHATCVLQSEHVTIHQPATLPSNHSLTANQGVGLQSEYILNSPTCHHISFTLIKRHNLTTMNRFLHNTVALALQRVMDIYGGGRV